MNHRGSEAPFDEDEKDDSDIDDIVKRNLMPLLDEQSLKPQKEYVKVFLRIRPFTKSEKERDENMGCVEVENENSVIVQAPKDSHTHRSTMYGLAKQVQKFTFTKVFGENTSQKAFFDETMLSTVKDFINGENCLVFSYGVTNSGKTYTIQGDPRDGGLLPRSLDVVFNSINSRIYSRMDLKPNMYCDVVRLSSEQEQKEIAFKESIMRMTFDDRVGSCSVVSDVSNSLPVMSEDSLNHPERDSVLDEISTVIANRKREEATIDVRSQGHIRFSIWVSFVEIYNEQIFDLLVPIPKNKYDRRPTLNLREDKQGNPYVKDLRQICVSSADEAYRLLALGKRNQRIACTKLNQSSSRSHCIFSIKMIRVVDREQPHYARISMLSVCDLAGSERNQKADNAGDRLKEAGSINVSLMTLGRCINALRNNQSNKGLDRQQVVPFRDSKLTRIFHAYLTGKGRASMIVNISQCASIFDETLTCLRYSALAKQVVVRESLPVPKPCIPEVRSSHVPPLNPATTLSRNTVGWATPGTYLKMIEAGEISAGTDRFSTAKESDGSENDETINEEDEGGEEEEGHCTMTESSSCHVDDSRIEAQRAEYSKDRAILLEVIRQLKEKLQAEIIAKDMLEVKIRAEVCEEMKAQLVIVENNYQESLRLREEINEEKLERKLEILTEAMQKSKRRRLEDDVEACVPKHLLDAETSKVQKQCSRIEELEDELNTVRQELVHLKSSFSQVAKERESFAQETTKAQFFASDAKQKLDDMKTKLDESSITTSDLSEQIKCLTEECKSHELSVGKLTCVNSDLEAQNKRLGKELEDRETKISSLETELEDCRKHQISVNELKVKMNSEVYLEVSAEQDKKFKELEDEKEALQKTSGEKDTLIRELETQIADLKKESTSSRHELLLTVHKLNSAKDEIARLIESTKDSTQLPGLKTEVAELREKLSVSCGEVICLEEKLVAVNLENDNYKKEVQKTSEGHLELKCKILKLEKEISGCENSLSSKQAELALVSGERDELLLEKQRLVNIVSERGDQLVSLKNELSSCQGKLERAEELFRKEKSELLQDRENLAEQLRIKKAECVSDSTSQKQNMRPFSELEEKSRLIGELQTKLKDLSSEYEVQKVTAGKSAQDVVHLQLEVASLVEQISRQKRAESGYLETLQKENQLLQQKLTASEELSHAMERQLQSSKSEAAELKMQLESRAETNTRLSRFSAKKKSYATSGLQKPTHLSANDDADDEADRSRLEFENIINRNLQEVTNASLTRYELRSACSRSTDRKCRENVDPMDSEQDETSDTPRQYSARKTPSVIKKQSTGDRSSIFKSPPKSPSLGKRRRKLLNIEEQLTATPIQEESQEMAAAPSPHASVIRKLRSHRP